MKKFFALLAALGMAFGLAVPASATLLNRGGGMIYDTDLNITWLQDMNYAKTSGYDADGFMTWAQAMTWAAGLSYGGYDDWRLPATLQPDPSCAAGYNCTGSELGHLYYTEMGNGIGGLTNIGPFTDLPPGGSLYVGWWWSATEYDADHAWRFGFNAGSWGGGQFGWDKPGFNYAWAVRDGDVLASVPEPGTLLLLGSGLIGLAGWARRRREGKEKRL